MPMLRQSGRFSVKSFRGVTAWIALAAASWASTAHAELLVLQSASSGQGRSVVHRVNADTGIFAAPLAPENEALYALAVSPQNDVFVSANVLGYGLIQKFDAQGRAAGVLAELPETDLRALAVGPDGAVYALASVGSDLDSVIRQQRILRITREGAVQVWVDETAAPLHTPTALAFATDGTLYVTDAERGVLAFDGATGAFRGVLIPAGRGGLERAAGLAVDASGRLYVTSGSRAVLRFAAGTGAFIDTFVLPGAGNLSGARGLAFAADGSLHVCSTASHAVLRYDGQTGTFLGASALHPSLRAPTALAFTHETPASGLVRQSGSTSSSFAAR